MRLKDKVAIITGGSRGIGKSIANAFLKEGAKATIAARSKTEICSTIRDLKQKGELIGIPTDVSREEEVENLIKQTLKHYGTLDILVNAAGIQSPIGSLTEVDIQEWINNIHTNLIGTVLCCKAALPVMLHKKRGKIVNFSGGGANYSRPNFSAYGVSKAAIVRLTEILADELKDYNIQVNAVSPGTIRTRMTDEIIKAGPEKAGEEYKEVKLKSKAGFDSPDSVVQLVCYLAMDESYWITGKVISAVWDPWKEWRQRGEIKIDKDLYVLRRIDGKNYIKVNK
jgi:3-oxoacyl-[acyl-carrier protein] reductase